MTSATSGKPNVRNTKIKLPDLQPHPHNPRVITSKQMEMLRRSLNEFGDLSGIVVNRRTGMLVGGHQRTKAFDDLQKKNVQVVNRYDPPTSQGTVLEGFIQIGNERFAYREVDWPDEKAEAAMLAANQHGGEWDDRMLTDLLKRQSNAGDLELTGFERSDLDRLIANAEDETVEDGCADTAPVSDRLADTGFTLGEYRFRLNREEYLRWQEELRRSVGFEKAPALQEIKNRLRL